MPPAVQNLVTFPAPDETQTQALSADIASQLSGLPTAIVDIDTYRRAKESLPLLKRAEDKVVSFFRDMKDQAHRAHKAITTKESEQLKPIAQARQRLSGLIYGFEQEQERIRRQREREAAEALRREEEARALAEAVVLESQGAPEMAEQVIEQAIVAPAPIVIMPSAAVDVVGVTTRENWQFLYQGGSPGQKWKDLSDEQRKRVLQLIPRDYLMPDEAAIGRVVKAMKSGTKIPGLQAYDAGTIAVRG
jgi:hypothetical protein